MQLNYLNVKTIDQHVKLFSKSFKKILLSLS